jgi:hypothetical protein
MGVNFFKSKQEPSIEILPTGAGKSIVISEL